MLLSIQAFFMDFGVFYFNRQRAAGKQVIFLSAALLLPLSFLTFGHSETLTLKHVAPPPNKKYPLTECHKKGMPFVCVFTAFAIALLRRASSTTGPTVPLLSLLQSLIFRL